MYCLLFLIIYNVLSISDIFMLPIAYLFIISYLGFGYYVDQIDTTDGLAVA